MISDESTDDLIEHFPEYREHGINAVSVFFMGSRFGDVKGYRADASLDPVYADRMARIIKAADKQKMIVVVGCLYWSTSKSKDALSDWGQEDANRAIANTTRWLSDHDYRNVFVDVDNEGMAHDAKGWSIAEMIDAGHAVDPSIMLAYNDGDPPPDNADLYIHHSPKVKGKPWLDTEATPGKSTLGGYWGNFSKQTHKRTGGSYYNYSRIGRYTEAMKAEQIRRTVDEIERYNGHMLASTWLQCASNESIGGPFADPGGHSRIKDVDIDVDRLHSDAGIRWWLDFVKDKYGAWDPGKRGTVSAVKSIDPSIRDWTDGRFQMVATFDWFPEGPSYRSTDGSYFFSGRNALTRLDTKGQLSGNPSPGAVRGRGSLTEMRYR
ncbi:hypothetical protein [Stieleria maiorica]|uniref:hypothetical protein n=1 Tax=Stieleria maiorica TaxID=2795974 RepID=UPI0011C9B5BA|nr:hypothetical protein [Stieleria maiorica]